MARKAPRAMVPTRLKANPSEEALFADEEKPSEDEEESVETFTDPEQVHSLGENIYALLIAEVSQSYTKLFVLNGLTWLAVTRVLFSLLMVLSVISLQVFLLNSVSAKLCTPSVRNIREIYSQFQKAIYAENTYRTVNGFFRGLDNAEPNLEGFKALTLEDKVNICSVPLSQPKFTFIILLIWTMTCLAEIRSSLRLLHIMMVKCETVGDITQCIADRDGQRMIVGLTRGLKSFLSVFCFLPRIGATVFLNYLGCRWLLSTANLQDLFLNSLALEFMVVLPELLYRTFATDRGMKLTETMMILAYSPATPHGRSLLVSMLYVIFAFVWVGCYMLFLQQVLPGYNWDVRPICSEFPEIFLESA